MRNRFSRFYQVDVFTTHAGGGNPLGVVVDADDWTTAEMQAFATWTDLVETTFLLRPDPSDSNQDAQNKTSTACANATTFADYHVRIFTPTQEIAYAGHPSVGSAFVAMEAGLVSANREHLVQSCGLGLIPIRIESIPSGRRISVQAPHAKSQTDSGQYQALVTSAVSSLASNEAPVLMEGGRRWWIVEAQTELDLRQWQPDHVAIAALAQASNSLGLCAFARCEASEEQNNPPTEYDVVVRAFPAGVGIIEDPASGAANGMIAAHIQNRYADSALSQGYRVSQGREIGRDARIDIQFDQGKIWVGGQVQSVVVGQVCWPQSKS